MQTMSIRHMIEANSKTLSKITTSMKEANNKWVDNNNSIMKRCDAILNRIDDISSNWNDHFQFIVTRRWVVVSNQSRYMSICMSKRQMNENSLQAKARLNTTNSKRQCQSRKYKKTKIHVMNCDTMSTIFCAKVKIAIYSSSINSFQKNSRHVKRKASCSYDSKFNKWWLKHEKWRTRKKHEWSRKTKSTRWIHDWNVSNDIDIWSSLSKFEFLNSIKTFWIQLKHFEFN